MTRKPYSVNLWGSKPGTNDDCDTGLDFATLEEARACYADPRPYFVQSTPNHVRGADAAAWFELDGPDVHEERRNPGYRPSRDDDSLERSEFAHQQGMAFGVEAYNEAMGYEVDDG